MFALRITQVVYTEENVLTIPRSFKNSLISFDTKRFALSLCRIVRKSNNLNSDLKHDITVRELVSLQAKTKENRENFSTTVKI